MTDTDAALRAEADRLLESGLRTALQAYGDVHVVGSYALQLMVWRDLDVHLVRPDVDRPRFFALGASLAEVLSPARMHFRDERVMETAGLPRGLYWGIYLGDERAGAWKIDVWATDADGFRGPQQFEARLRRELTDERRAAITRVKSAVWRHADYRKRFTSADVYRAVIDAGVEDVDGFFAYVAAERRG